MAARLDGVLCEVQDFFVDEDGKMYVTVRPTEFRSFSREVSADRIVLENE